MILRPDKPIPVVDQAKRLIKQTTAICSMISMLIVSDALPSSSLSFGQRHSKTRTKTTQQQKQPRKTRVSKDCMDEQFEVGCELPFADYVIHEIDQRCPNSGICTAGERTKFQNKIKNNLCAKATPIAIGVTTLDQLQQVVDGMAAKHQITYGDLVPPKPKDRSKLKSLPTVDVNGKDIELGEGDLVILEGIVLDARHSNSFPLGLSGETVNCFKPSLSWNDIHIVLGESETSHECSSISAKIIPHYRPALWERFDSNSETSQFVPNSLPVKGLRVRIMGQLFFDGSHKPKPCRPPKRRTSWEIHPVYAIEVFDTSANQFVPLTQWAKDK